MRPSDTIQGGHDAGDSRDAGTRERAARERHARIKGACADAQALAPAERASLLRARLASESEVAEALALLGEIDRHAQADGDAVSVLGGEAVAGPGAYARTTEGAPAPAPPRGGVLRPGERLGPYEVVKWLGGGGMGDVYLCTKPEGAVRLPVAVKVIRKGMDSDQIVRRFEQERRLLGTLNQANIARLLDAATTPDGRPYLVMEYVPGLPIDAYCNDKKLNVQERLALFRKVCDAVHFAHANLIVHRDLKPSNILVDRNGEPKLVDFGIAKIMNPMLAAEGSGVFTLDAQRLMTPQYASPEQIAGKDVGTATDIYSLGVVLYELLTGRRPYALKKLAEEEMRRIVCELVPAPPSLVVNPEGSRRATRGPAAAPDGDALADGTGGTATSATSVVIATNRGTRPAALRRTLQGDIDTIVMHALEKVDRRRYRSVAEFATDIDNYFGGRPLVARPPSAWTDTWKFVRRHKAGAAATLSVAAVLALSSGVMWRLWQRSERAEAATRVEKQATLEVFDGFAQALAALRQDRDGTLTDTTLEQTLTPLLAAVERVGPRDADLMRQAAGALESYGLTAGVASWGGRQRARDAGTALGKAIALRERVAGLPGAPASDTLHLARTLGLAAENRRWETDPAEVEQRIALAERAVSLCDGVLTRAPGDVPARVALGRALFKRVQVARRGAGDGREAEALEQAARVARLLDVRRTLAKEAKPRDHDLDADLASALLLAADRSEDAHDHQRLKWLEECLSLRQTVAAAQRDRWEPAVLALRARTRLGSHLCQAMNRTADGLRELEQARVQAERIEAAFSGVPMPPNVRVAVLQAYAELSAVQATPAHVDRMWALFSGTALAGVQNDRNVAANLMMVASNAAEVTGGNTMEKRTLAGLAEWLARALEAHAPDERFTPEENQARARARRVLFQAEPAAEAKP